MSHRIAFLRSLRRTHRRSGTHGRPLAGLSVSPECSPGRAGSTPWPARSRRPFSSCTPATTTTCGWTSPSPPPPAARVGRSACSRRVATTPICAHPPSGSQPRSVAGSVISRRGARRRWFRRAGCQAESTCQDRSSSHRRPATRRHRRTRRFGALRDASATLDPLEVDFLHAPGRPRGAHTQERGQHEFADRRYRTRLRGRDHRGHDQFPRLDRRLVGGAVLAPEGLHAGLHDRARLHGQDQARVRHAEREGHRALGRSDRQPPRVGGRHRGDPGARRPTTRSSATPTSASRSSTGCCPPTRRGDPAQAHAGRQPDRAQRLRDRPGQEGQADPRLPDDDRAATSTRCCA